MSFTKEPAALSVKKILLATDFTAASEKAASYAKALARRFNSWSSWHMSLIHQMSRPTMRR
jgi:hypothetical protein